MEMIIYKFTVNDKYTFFIIGSDVNEMQKKAKEYYLANNTFCDKTIEKTSYQGIIKLSEVVNFSDYFKPEIRER